MQTPGTTLLNRLDVHRYIYLQMITVENVSVHTGSTTNLDRDHMHPQRPMDRALKTVERGQGWG